MYLYFDKTGKLKEIVNDEALRQGNFGVNKMYIYVEDRTYSSADVSYLLPSGTIVSPINYDTFTDPDAEENENCFIPFDSKRDLRYFKYYKPYKFLIVDLEADLNGNSPLDEAGVVHCNISINLISGILALGELNFNVEVDSTLNTHYVASEEYLSLSNYLFLRNLINEYEQSSLQIVEADNTTTLSSLIGSPKIVHFQNVYYTAFVFSPVSNVQVFEIEYLLGVNRYFGQVSGNITFAQAVTDTYKQQYAVFYRHDIVLRAVSPVLDYHIYATTENSTPVTSLQEVYNLLSSAGCFSKVMFDIGEYSTVLNAAMVGQFSLRIKYVSSGAGTTVSSLSLTGFVSDTVTNI